VVALGSSEGGSGTGVDFWTGAGGGLSRGDAAAGVGSGGGRLGAEFAGWAGVGGVGWGGTSSPKVGGLVSPRPAAGAGDRGGGRPLSRPGG